MVIRRSFCPRHRSHLRLPDIVQMAPGQLTLWKLQHCQLGDGSGRVESLVALWPLHDLHNLYKLNKLI